MSLLPNHIVLGTWRFGGVGFGKDNEAKHLELGHTAIQAGITQFDTAHFYGQGQAEKRLAKVIKSYNRCSLHISSKGGIHWQGNKVGHDASLKQLKATLETSLTNLKTSYLDCFYLHWPDPKVSISHCIEHLVTLQNTGLTKEIGLCNLSVAQVLEALATGVALQWQLPYSPLRKDSAAQLSMLPNKQVMLISLFEQGLLLSAPDRQFGKSDVRRRNSFFNTQLLSEFQQAQARQSKLAAHILQDVHTHYPQAKLCVGPASSAQLVGLLK
eukprot:COSAG01_NODE_2676_length_7264_cov_6.952128_5_plen_270_part_00